MTDASNQDGTTALIHVTSVAIDNQAVLLMGKSGAGKSDLALRLIDRGAQLISDDYTRCQRRDGQLFAFAPPTIAGKMEVRYIGLVAIPHVHNVPVALAISLDDKPQRMPDQSVQIDILGISLPVFPLDAFEASAPIKVELALGSLKAAKS